MSHAWRIVVDNVTTITACCSITLYEEQAMPSTASDTA